MKNNIKQIIKMLIFALTVFSISEADTIILDKNKATYIQTEKFMLAEGENILGPINLLPIAITDLVKFKVEKGKVVDYIYEPSSQNWKRAIVGKIVKIEGEGRVFKGRVIEIKDNYITLETKKGIIITTLPEFPSRITIQENYKNSFAPRLTIKIISNDAQEKNVNIIYPIKGISLKIKSLKISKKSIDYVIIHNNTPLNFQDINIVVKPLNKTLNKIFLPANSKKVIILTDKN